jgi:hypothetical protein
MFGDVLLRTQRYGLVVRQAVIDTGDRTLVPDRLDK